MSLTILILGLILFSVSAVTVVVLVVVPAVMDNAVVLRLGRLRDRLHDLDEERPGTLNHSDVERLDALLYSHMMAPRLPIHIVMGSAAVVLRAQLQGRHVDEPRSFKGLELDHQNDLQQIENEAVYFIVRSILLGSPVWALTWPVWLVVGHIWRKNGAVSKRPLPAVQRRAEAFVVFVGDPTDFEGWGISHWKRDERLFAG